MSVTEPRYRDPEFIARLQASCDASGVPLHVVDGPTLDRIITLTGIDGATSGAAPHTSEVKGRGAPQPPTIPAAPTSAERPVAAPGSAPGRRSAVPRTKNTPRRSPAKAAPRGAN